MKPQEINSRYTIELLGKAHQRNLFSCGVPELDIYIQQQATQDIRKKVATVFVAVEKDGTTIVGYYTLSMASVPVNDLPGDLARRMPRYPSLPAIRLGRLAVNQNIRGEGLGSYLLMDALYRAIGNEVAWGLFLVDAKDETAICFYKSFGFQSFNGNNKHLYLIRQTIEQTFG